MVELSKRLSKGRLKNRQGFTLVELAIVLVIIGIILGAMLKAQDLIQNARAKKFVSKVKAWEVAQWNFYDRKGRFAGDQDQNGTIGDGNNESVEADFLSANFINPPYEGNENILTIGSYKFHVFFGYDNNKKNVMILCKDKECNESFDTDYLVFLDALDTSIDGVADGTDGNVVCFDDGISNIDYDKWMVKVDNSTNHAECSNNTKAIVYYFDSGREE